MKIIHTSDWHIGAELYGHDRSADHRLFFDQLFEIMSDELPDALVVSGDIFDRVLPAHAAQKFFTESILMLHDASPTTEIIITAGNHDSAARLELTRPLWSHFKVHIVGYIERNGDEVNREKHIIYIPGCGYVIALPFVYPHAFPTAGVGEDRQRAFVMSLIELVRERNKENLPIVLMAHTAVSGSDFAGHRKIDSVHAGRDSVGNIEVVHFDELGEGYDYLALGHIHRPQEIRGSDGRAYYSGSPIAIGFDESYDHSVFVVNVEKDQVPDVRKVVINQHRSVVMIPDSPALLEEVLQEIEKQIGEKEDVFVRINLAVKGSVPIGAEAHIMDALEAKKGAIFCTIKYTDTSEVQRGQSSNVQMYESVRDNNPVDIALEYMSDKVDIEEREEYGAIIKSLWQEIIIGGEE